MTLNHTRYSDISLCWRKTFNKYHRRLESGHSISRTDGVATHAGLAHALATKDWEGGLTQARLSFDKEIASYDLLPAEQYQVQDNWEITELMFKLYQEKFASEDLQIIQPECEFNVPLTDTYHNCIWKHWRSRSTGEEFWSPPPAEAILSHDVMSPHNHPMADCSCLSRHNIVGRIDGIWLWKSVLWINDFKTTAQNPTEWWAQWALNYQPSIYIYGAQKALGIRPRGFIINAIFKPSEAQVAAWNSKRKSGALGVKDYLKYGREVFLRSDEDIERARVDFCARADEWEWRILHGAFPLSPPPGPACKMYHKTCEFEPLCVEHDAASTLEGYQVRTDWDYVEKELYQIEAAK